MELRGYPTNTEALVNVSSDELSLIMALVEAAHGRRRLAEEELDAADKLCGEADQIQIHVPGEAGFHRF